MTMVILDNDLANAIQAERRRDAARERLLNESVITARDPAPRFSLYRLGAQWLRGRLPVFLHSGGAVRARQKVSDDATG
jgi:hypothetical protein